MDIPIAGAESFIKPKTPETPTIPKISKIPGDSLKILEIPTTQTTPKIPSSLDIPEKIPFESSTAPKTPETPTTSTDFKIPVQKAPIFHEDPTIKISLKNSGSPTTTPEILQENDQNKTKVEENNESDKDSDDENYETLNLDQLKDLELSKLTMRQIHDNLSKIGVHGPFEKEFTDKETNDISEDNKKLHNKAKTKDESEDKSNDQTKDKLHSIWFMRTETQYRERNSLRIFNTYAVHQII